VEPTERARVAESLVATLRTLGRSDEAQSVERGEFERRTGAESGG
jgi:hypothetical protein